MLVSQASFAEIVGVSRKSVSVWKKEGRVIMVGKLVDVEASRIALQKFTSSRSRIYGNVIAMRWASNTETPEGNNVDPEFPPLPGAVANLTAAAESWAEDAAIAMLRHLPEPTVREVHADLLATWRKEGAELADDDIDPPPGYVSWADHPSFAAPVTTNWDELREIAGATP